LLPHFPLSARSLERRHTAPAPSKMMISSYVSHDEEETLGLIAHGDSKKKLSLAKHPRSKHVHGENNLGFTFSVRLLSAAFLTLLTTSHVLLAHQCLVQERPYIQKYHVNTKHTSLKIYSKPSDKGKELDSLRPGQIVELYERDDSEFFHRILRPSLGFVRKVGLRTGKPYFTPLDVAHAHPLTGWWPERKKLARHLYAPTSLVVAQQLWNALQVLVLYLIIALNYCRSRQGHDDSSIVKWTTRLVSLAAVAILPFSVYLISPGGHSFAFAALLLGLLGIFQTPHPNLRLSIGERDGTTITSSNSSPSWTLGCEETLGCLCTLGSSLYNYAGGPSNLATLEEPLL